MEVKCKHSTGLLKDDHGKKEVRITAEHETNTGKKKKKWNGRKTTTTVLVKHKLKMTNSEMETAVDHSSHSL